MRKLVRKKTFGHSTIYLIALFFASILIGVGYAYLNSNLQITGTTTITKATWDVHFENLKQTGGNITSNSSTIENNSTVVNFDITLENPGDYYEFTVDVKNAGTIDAMVSSIVNLGLSEGQQTFLNYQISYNSGKEIKEKDLLSAGDSTTIKVSIKYRDDITVDDLPGEDQNLELQLNLIYIQADSSAIAVVNPVCKRATTLHTETCNQSSNYCAGSGYAVGDTITYGNLGTAGILTSGDAFDCDVNGDGVYDSETERFYYITDLSSDSSYAVLTYYSNVSAGQIENTTEHEYNLESTGSNDTMARGPKTAILELPKVTQWKNVNLSNTERDITDQNGTVQLAKFSYSGYAARLLTYQEAIFACGGTSSNSCKYLNENTTYANNNWLNGHWLETADATGLGRAYKIDTSASDGSTFKIRPVYAANADWSTGVRPTIEVEKTKIMY